MSYPLNYLKYILNVILDGIILFFFGKYSRYKCLRFQVNLIKLLEICHNILKCNYINIFSDSQIKISYNFRITNKQLINIFLKVKIFS